MGIAVIPVLRPPSSAADFRTGLSSPQDASALLARSLKSLADTASDCDELIHLAFAVYALPLQYTQKGPPAPWTGPKLQGSHTLIQASARVTATSHSSASYHKDHGHRFKC